MYYLILILARYYCDHDNMKGKEIAVEYYHKAICLHPNWGNNYNTCYAVAITVIFNFNMVIKNFQLSNQFDLK